LVDLAKNVGPRQAAAGAEAAVVAKRAATDSNRAIDIGAGKSCVDADLLYAATKSLPKVKITGKVG
jgi:hypothetical protein